MKNIEVAKLLYNIADILELQEVQWKPQAYRKAAQAIESLSEDIEELQQNNKLKEIPGVGENIAEKIDEYLSMGKLKYYDQLKKEVKVDLERLNEIPSLGPKKIKLLYQKLGVKTIADLEKSIKLHKVRQLEGFGEKTEQTLQEGITLIKTRPKRFLYAYASSLVNSILHTFRAYPFIHQMEVAGSFRRGRETVGDLDFLAVSPQPEKVMDKFTTMNDVKEILAKGSTKSSVRLSNGLQIDLRVVKDKEFGSAMNYFIGSKEHNVELRKLALSKGYTLSEYGLFQLNGKKWIAGKTEEDIYQKLGLEFIEPELRENRGEITAAQQKKLPSLIATKDLNGIFHNHSAWSDGNNSLLEMAQKAEALGLKFISFNDHFGPMGITNPLTEKRLTGYLKEIDRVQKKVGIRVFSGVEIDILKDGTLPLSMAKLKELDVVIASVHLATKMPTTEMTKRVCSAMEKYPIHILGHPTDRLLNEREPIALNMGAVSQTAKERGVFLEINGSPSRMDLCGEQVKNARDLGCQFALSADAHSVSHLPYYSLGINMARRGWLEKKDVLNCWTLQKIEKVLKR